MDLFFVSRVWGPVDEIGSSSYCRFSHFSGLLIMYYMYINLMLFLCNICSVQCLSVCCTVIINSFKTQWNEEVDLALDLSLNNDAYGQRDISIIV